MQTEFELRADGWWGPPLDPDEIKPYTVDFKYVDSFGTESISSVTWTLTNCTLHAQSNTATAATVVVKTGTNGQTATISCAVVTTPSAYRFDRTFKVSVQAL
jgi:hypothetical protein